MNDSSPVARRLSLSMRTEPRSGTVLMEAVFCLPLLLFLVTGIVQFSRIWEAKLFTKHAAYNAARATLVYNTAEYATTNKLGRIEFLANKGVAWVAAVDTLAWKSATFDSAATAPMGHLMPGFEGNRAYRIDSSSFVHDRAPGQVVIDKSQSWESNGMVRVTVRFKYPLLFSVFSLGAVRHGDTSGDPAPLVHDTALDVKRRSRWDDSIPHIELVESCVLPKPWSTAWYPRVGKSEASYMELNSP